MLVAAPVIRVGIHLVDDSRTAPVHTNRLGKHTWCLAVPCVKGVEASHQVAFHRGCPHVLLFGTFHAHSLQCLATLSVLIDTHFHALGCPWGKQSECGLLRLTFHLGEVEVAAFGHCLAFFCLCWYHYGQQRHQSC